MVQQYLPMFKEGVQLINNRVGYEKRDGKIYYYVGQAIITSHQKDDMKSFRCTCSQLVETGNVRQCEIIKAFKVSKKSVLRNVAKYRSGGVGAFYQKRKSRGAKVLTDENIDKIEDLLSKDKKVKDIAEELKIKQNTIEKAIRSKRIKKKVPSRNKMPIKNKAARKSE